MKNITKLSKLAKSTWKNCFFSIRRLYEAIIISQIIYCCSMWYTPPRKKSHKKWMLKNLRNIQAKVLKIIIKAFKATTKSALNIKVYVLSIKQRLKKLINDIMLRIIITSLYKNIINKRFKKQKRKRISLKKLNFKFKKRIEMKSKSIKKIKSFIILLGIWIYD